jgi:hypothetical protein
MFLRRNAAGLSFANSFLSFKLLSANQGSGKIRSGESVQDGVRKSNLQDRDSAVAARKASMIFPFSIFPAQRTGGS